MGRRTLYDRGLVSLQVKVNLRWVLRPICWQHGHDWNVVLAMDAFSRSFRYCNRCGYGWRLMGLKRCWRKSQHRWDRHPSSLGPSTQTMPDGSQQPFRDLQWCERCHLTRVVDCATGKEVLSTR